MGQFVSLLGSGLSAFGLSVWIYIKTGSATPFAMSFLCSILPTIIFAPFAGSFADRKKRKVIIMMTDSLDALLKLLMAALLFFDLMQVWVVYPILFTSAILSTFQGPAFNASIPILVPAKHLSRANGMLQFSQACQSMLAPILAGPLADNVFEPLMKNDGSIGSNFIGSLIGTGPGRGIGLLFILCGIILNAVCFIMLCKKQVMSMEKRLPDVSN